MKTLVAIKAMTPDVIPYEQVGGNPVFWIEAALFMGVLAVLFYALVITTRGR